jgi:uncharacterized protein YndB with AHSA1/START domain
MSHAGGLQVTTPSDTEIAMTRVFDAPRRLVFEAYTKPELVRRWLGVFGDFTMPVCEIDLRVGGAFHFVWKGPGFTMGMRGVYREIVPGERIVATEKFDEAWYEGEAVNTVTFVERNGKTTVTNTVRYATRAVRDAVLKTPMETGVAAGYDTLDGVLSTLTQEAT